MRRQQLGFIAVLVCIAPAAAAAQVPQRGVLSVPRASGVGTIASDCVFPLPLASLAFRFTPAYGSNPWPLELITNISSPDVKLMANGQHGVVSGFTRPAADAHGAHLSPVVRIEWNFFPAASDDGWCAYVAAVHIRHPALEIYIASEYGSDSCDFRETRTHESLHYADLSAALRKSQQRIRAAFRRIALPTSRKPWHLAREARDVVTGARAELASVVQIAIQRIADDTDTQAVVQGRRRDAPARVDAAYRGCDSWLGVPDRYVARTSLK